MNTENFFVKACKSLGDIKGMTNRCDYWRYTLVVILFLFVLWFALMACGDGKDHTTISSLLVLVLAPILLFSVQVRRMHDIGRTALLPVLTNISYLFTVFSWAYILNAHYDSIANDNFTMQVPLWIGYIGLSVLCVSVSLCMVLFVFSVKK